MNNFVIMIEGQDRTGKDTLVKKLVKKYFNRQPFVIHSIGTDKKGEEGRNLSKEYYSQMFKMMNRLKNNFILNRSHIGDYIYSPLYRDYDGDYVFDLEKKLSKTKKYFLICLIDSSTKALKREDNESLSKGNKKLFLKEQHKFVVAISNSNIKNKLIIDIANKSEEEVFNLVDEFLGEL